MTTKTAVKKQQVDIYKPSAFWIVVFVLFVAILGFGIADHSRVAIAGGIIGLLATVLLYWWDNQQKGDTE